MIIGFSGYGQAGKDTAVGILVKKHGFVRGAFADVLKYALCKLNPIIFLPEATFGFARLQDLVDSSGWDVVKMYEEPRRLLQVLGTEVGRNMIDNDIWINALFYHGFLTNDLAAISDMRFKSEAIRVKGLPGGFTVRIDRPGVGPLNDHQSETDLDNWDFDYRIQNDGTIEDLELKLEEMLQELNPR